MRQRFCNTGAAALLALLVLTPFGVAHAKGMLIQMNQGVVCDEADQVEEIVSQFGQKPLRQVVLALNERTGKHSCGMINRPLFLMMEPVRTVSTPGGNMLIVKLTTHFGLVQYTWEPKEKPKPGGQAA